MNDANTIDRGVRRRRGLMGTTMILAMAALAAADTLYDNAGTWRLVDFVRVGAIFVIALILSLRSTSAFSLVARDRKLDDELTRANRADAARWGFWALMGALMATFVASFYFVALRLSDVAPMVMVIGAAAAGLRFVTLERRAE